MPRKPRNAAPADDDLRPLPPPSNGAPEDDDSDEGDGDDDDGDGEDSDEGDDDGPSSGPPPLRNGFVELPPAPRHAPPLVEVSPAQLNDAPRGGRRASGGPPPSPNPRGIRGPRNFSDADRANSPALKSVQRFQEAAYAEIDTLLATLNFSNRQYEVRVSRFEPEADENGVPCTGLLHTYKQKVTVDQIQQRFGGGLYEIKIWGPHPTSGRQAIIKQETIQIAGHPKPMPSNKDDGRDRDRERGSELADALRTIADSNERNQARVLSVMEKNANVKPISVNDIVTGLTTALAPLVDKFLTKSESDKQLEIEARREEREERRRQEDQKREDERNRREDERRAYEERRDAERKAEEKRREEDRERREEERKAEEKRREEDRERREEERRAEDKKREEERERLREEREKERERMKEEAAERQRQHEREMAAQAERNKADAERTKEYLAMVTNLQKSNGFETVMTNLRLFKELKDDVNGVNDEPSKLETFNEGLHSFVKTVTPIAKEIRGALNERKQGQPNQQQQQNPQQVPQQNQQQAPQGQPGQVIAVDIGPVRRQLPQGGASGGMVVPTQQPAAQAQAQPQPAQPAAQANPGEVQPVGGQQPGDGEPNDLIDFVFASEGDAMLDVGTKLIKDVDLAIQRNMSPDDIVDKILNRFDDDAPMLMSMASGMSPEELSEFIAGNVPSTWAILSPRGDEIVQKAFEIWRNQSEEPN